MPFNDIEHTTKQACKLWLDLYFFLSGSYIPANMLSNTYPVCF